MPVYQGAANHPAFSKCYVGTQRYRKIYDGTTLVWSDTLIHDGFDWDGWLQGWINELCSAEDLGDLISDGYGMIVDGLGNVVGSTVAYIQDGVNETGKLVANAGTSLVDAYCGAWGGSAPPDGLIGLVNGIPIIGGILADWLAGDIDIESIIGSLKNGMPVIVEDGVAKLMDRSAFAGSVATTDRLVRTMHKLAGIPIIDAVRMMTSTPARIMNIRDKGRLAPDTAADIVLFDDDIRVSSVFLGGEQKFGA